jgi:RHS repeat-associated protein
VTITFTGGVPNAPSSSLLRAQSDAAYDEQGRVYQTKTYSVNPSSGSVSTYALTSNTYFDHRGNTIEVSAPGGLVTKYVYDGAGRGTKTYTTDGASGTSWSSASSVTGDAVLEQVEETYDSDGNVILITTRQRNHDETATGALGNASTSPKARVSYFASYYDAANRPTASVDVGTNGGSAYTRPSTVPSRSDTVLITSYAYNSAGWVETTTDSLGLVGKTYYDALGRTTKTIEDYTDGTPRNESDKTTEYTYDGDGNMLTQKADLASGYQETEWIYGSSTSTSDVINSNDVLKTTEYPDPTSGNPSSSQAETLTVNGLGETLTLTDRAGRVHTITRDVLGRTVSDAVTTLGSGVDGAVRRIETAYDTQGNAYLFTTYDAASGGNVVNQVQRSFNGLGQLTTEYQAVSGSVNVSSTPKVQLAYTEMSGGVNNSRQTSMTYPGGYVLNFNYSSGLNDSISRLSSLSDSTGTLESYQYLGLSSVVDRSHPQIHIDLTYIKQSGESSGDAGDQYTGLDRFGRIVDQRWLNTSTGTATDRFQYGYDRDSNRLWRDNLVNAAFGELYSYNGENEISSFSRGTLNSGKTGLTGSASRSQSWAYDALGNWSSVTSDATTQTRSANKQNEITSVSGATTPAYDSNGNLTTDETGKQFVYDAWNRLVTVKNSAGVTLETLAYDGLGRRVGITIGATTTNLYYSAQWQVLEERVAGVTTTRYVWSPVYIDALVLRDFDPTGMGTLSQRLWVQQDANWNVTALVDNTTGLVVERYAYDPFGSVTVYDPSYTVRAAGSNYAWVYLHQGGRFDAVSGLYNFQERDYSSTLGRWLETDPWGLAAGDMNLYRDESNDPLMRLDPHGLDDDGGTANRLRGGDVLIRTKCDPINHPNPSMFTDEDPRKRASKLEGELSKNCKATGCRYTGTCESDFEGICDQIKAAFEASKARWVDRVVIVGHCGGGKCPPGLKLRDPKRDEQDRNFRLEWDNPDIGQLAKCLDDYLGPGGSVLLCSCGYMLDEGGIGKDQWLDKLQQLANRLRHKVCMYGVQSQVDPTFGCVPTVPGAKLICRKPNAAAGGAPQPR